MTGHPSPSPNPEHPAPSGQPHADPPSADDPPPPSEAGVPGVPDPEQAWKALGLVNDWVRHADTKTGAFLAAAGVTGGVFYNLVKDQHKPTWWLSAVATACAVAIFLAAGFALLALMPRLSVKKLWRTILRKPEPAPDPDNDETASEDPASLLFFRDIARSYESDNAPSYADVLATLTGDKARLTKQIGNQVHQNAHVAHRKFRWSTWSLRALACDLLLLAWTAYLVGKH